MEATSRAPGCSETERSPHVRWLTPETLGGATSPQMEAVTASVHPAPATTSTHGAGHVCGQLSGLRGLACVPLSSPHLAQGGPVLGTTDRLQPRATQQRLWASRWRRQPEPLPPGILEPEGKSPGRGSVSEHPGALGVASNSQTIPVTTYRAAHPQMLVCGKSAAHLFGSQGR